MAGAFRIAEGYVEVTADEDSYDRAMARLKAKKHTIKVGVDLDDRDVLARLQRLSRTRIVTAKVNLDQTALSALSARNIVVTVAPQMQDVAYRRVQRQLDELTRDRMVRILADADTRVAADDIANLTRRRTLNVTAHADTEATANSLRFLTHDRTVNVRTRMGGLGSLAGLDSSMGQASSSAGMLSSRFMKLAAAALGAMPTLASLGTSLIQMGPAAAVAAPALLSLGAAFSVIKLGMSGIGDAFKAAFAPAEKSAAAAASATRSVENAQRSLAKAQQGVRDAEVNVATARVRAARDIQDAQLSLKNTVQQVADANRRAAEQVAGAERDLADAQRAARRAQEDLTQARKGEAEGLVDLNNRLEDARLAERRDILALADAQQNLDAVKAKGAAATQEEIDKAQLAYDEAMQALQEQQTETKRLQDKTDAANKAGVEGSASVSAAKQGIVDANRAVADQAKAVADAEAEAARAQQDGAQQTARAQRDVADARAAASKAAVDGARQVADAQAAVADAARALADAQAAGAAATNKVATALAKLSPNARSFVQAVIDQGAGWRALKLGVQDRLFQGLGATFTTMSTTILPSMKTGLGGTAEVLNAMATNAMSAVTNLAKTGTLKQMFAGLNEGLKPLSRIPGQFITGLAQLSVAASPAFARITTAASGVADSIAKKLGEAFKSGALTEMINNAIGIAKQFGSLLADVFGTLGNIFKAASAGGGDALGALGAVFQELRRITEMPEVQRALTSIFTAVNAIAKLLAGTLGAVIQAVLPVLASLAPVVAELATALGPSLAGLAKILGEALLPIADALGPVLTLVGDLLIGLVTAVTPLLKPIGDLIAAVITALTPVLGEMVGTLVEAAAALSGPLADVISSLIPMAAPLAKIFTSMWMAMLPLVPSVLELLPPLGELAVALLTLATQILIPLVPLFDGVAAVLAGALSGGIAVLVPVITTVIGWLTAFTDAVTAAVDWIVDKFTWLFDVLVGHSIVPDLITAIIALFTGLWNRSRDIFNGMMRAIVAIWNGLWKSVRDSWNSFWRGLSAAVGSARTWLGNSFSGLRTTITNTWSGLWNGVQSKFGSVISAVRTGIGGFVSGTKKAFSDLRDSLGTIWGGIQGKFASPVRYVVNRVYNDGIRAMWDTIASKVGLPQLPKIKLAFARGGVVPGTGTGDTVPAMLTPGERILSLAQVDQLGGHRGIDAMLGKDRPTGTGGNPSQAQERKRRQPVQRFDIGGIVDNVKGVGGSIAGGISSGVDWAKDLVVGGLQAAARKAVSSIVQPLINQIPAGGVGELMRGLSGRSLDGILSKLGKEDKKAAGGPAVQKGLSWARTQDGLPYQWAGNGNPSWDCSGLLSAIESVIRGETPHRRWATGAFSGGSAPSGWVRNLVSPYMIGITNAGVGHTAGTIGGVNVESRGGDGVVVGSRARGYDNSLFTDRYGFKPATQFDTGGILQPGATMAVNRTGKPEAVLNPADRAKFEALIRGGGGGGIAIENLTLHVAGTFDLASPGERKRAANAMVAEMKEALRVYDRGRR
jgi:phage-related protein